ncbi:hypothetical protein L208DRAFT_695828 [Tricholoma matsutake]|nr:hypothetical protein L208DRAFT_695828 [Tricholoma matsutake 945]
MKYCIPMVFRPSDTCVKVAVHFFNINPIVVVTCRSHHSVKTMEPSPSPRHTCNDNASAKSQHELIKTNAKE